MSLTRAPRSMVSPTMGACSCLIGISIRTVIKNFAAGAAGPPGQDWRPIAAMSSHREFRRQSILILLANFRLPVAAHPRQVSASTRRDGGRKPGTLLLQQMVVAGSDRQLLCGRLGRRAWAAPNALAACLASAWDWLQSCRTWILEIHTWRESRGWHNGYGPCSASA